MAQTASKLRFGPSAIIEEIRLAWSIVRRVEGSLGQGRRAGKPALGHCDVNRFVPPDLIAAE